jgi:DnaJ-class molecular chaperone
MKICNWCKGSGKIKLTSYGVKTCPNCKGSGIGDDGGEKITGKSKPWMIGNRHGLGNRSRKNG